MNPSLRPPIAPGKKVAAFVCLLAVVLLWGPLWAAALQANGMACCTGGMCLAHIHSKSNYSGATTSPTSEMPTQCDHSGQGSKMKCVISCCHDQGQTFLASIHFVLPHAPILGVPQNILATSLALEVAQNSQRNDPLSPPPRNTLL